MNSETMEKLGDEIYKRVMEVVEHDGIATEVTARVIEVTVQMDKEFIDENDAKLIFEKSVNEDYREEKLYEQITHGLIEILGRKNAVN